MWLDSSHQTRKEGTTLGYNSSPHVVQNEHAIHMA